MGQSARDRADCFDSPGPDHPAAQAAGSLALPSLAAAAHTAGDTLAAREQNKCIQSRSTISSAGTDNRIFLTIAEH